MSTQPVQSSRAPRPLRRPRPTIVAVCLAAALLGLGIAARPWLMWAAQIDRAAELIEQGTDWPAERSSDTIPAVRDPRRLEEARAALDAAAGWRPDDAHAYRLRGQIALAEGRWEEAEADFEQAGRRAPANPLIAWELALAYEQRHAIGWGASDQAVELRRLWEQAGLTMEQLMARGDEARRGNRPDEALRWYRRASVFAPEAGIPWYYAGLVYEGRGQSGQALRAYEQAVTLQPDLSEAWNTLTGRAEALFRQRDWPAAHGFYQQALRKPDQPAAFQFRAALAGSSANAPPRDLLNSLGVPVRGLAAVTIIEGETMHWLESTNPTVLDGTRLDGYPQNGARTAALWWSGAAAAVIDVPAGACALTVRAASTPGVAAALAVEVDGVEVGTFETALDGSYSQHQIQLDLAGGTHAVSVRFLNNGTFNGVDNNAFIDWVRIAR